HRIPSWPVGGIARMIYGIPRSPPGLGKEYAVDGRSVPARVIRRKPAWVAGDSGCIDRLMSTWAHKHMGAREACPAEPGVMLRSTSNLIFWEHDRFFLDPPQAQAEIVGLDQQQVTRHLSNDGFRGIADDKSLDPTATDDAHGQDLSRQLA